MLDSRAYEHGCLIAPRLVCSIQSFLMGRFFHPRMLPLAVSNGQEIQEQCEAILAQFALLRTQLLRTVSRL